MEKDFVPYQEALELKELGFYSAQIHKPYGYGSYYDCEADTSQESYLLAFNYILTSNYI